MKTIYLKINCVLCFFFLVNYTLTAQKTHDNSIQKSEMAKISFLEGDWKGSGWIMRQDRKKHYFEQSENVILTLNGTAILIEGIGKQERDTVHHALAIINYDTEKQEYNFRSYLKDGKSGDSKMELLDEKLYWYPTSYIRYIISINENNEWIEIGEINKADNWYKFFEMKLTKL
ncbi:hypothetical protein QYS49_31105 [Marivirga salinae]|uniref:DUF1579 domain-containing protein n=1 Tax=Marivirga salinarum TaxID=3059078 RepID=A0AA49JGS7_9BACT|nr:hypothetical protein [Marivirga sp. BDSF4-3]WKK75820.2 hypothetical protein QYS49_31105 [Marivirga sp. BDSF4-3]